MQQDRSTGWRLGTNRTIQFRFQVVGIAMGAVMCVLLAHLFMQAYPQLRLNVYDDPKADVGAWQSAMTYKFVGALRDIGHLPAHKVLALWIGLGLGFATELARKLLARSAGWKRFVVSGRPGFAAGWTMDAVLLPSPYASSFGGFVDVLTAAWFAAGGTLTSLVNTWTAGRPRREDLPEDMSATSLVGGGLIAGESLYALGTGVAGLLALWL